MGSILSQCLVKPRSRRPGKTPSPIVQTDFSALRTSGNTIPVTSPQNHNVPLAGAQNGTSHPVRKLPPPPLPPPSGPPKPAEHRRQLLSALYNYEAQNADDLSFRKGDRFELIEKQDSGWWLAKKDDCTGYVPSNYVQIDDGRPENSDCYFSLVRRDAERMLLAPFVKDGQFIVRPSSDSRSLALSVRTSDMQGLPVVRHYRVRLMDNDRGYYIATQVFFDSFTKMIEHYRARADGLCCQLTTPCPKSRPTHLRMRDVEVSRRNVAILREIGRGNFGQVYYGKLNGVIDVAVKQLKNNGQMSSEKFVKEAQIMHRLVHEKIVQLIAVCTNEQPVLIITEYLPKGSLAEYLRDLGSRHLSSCPAGWNALVPRFSKHVDMMAQVAMGMAYLEKHNFIHRDLRAANILVGEDNEVKVSDFGLAALIEEQEGAYMANEKAKFPIRWTAPEAITDHRFSVKSDVWSFGVLIYEIVTMGRQPYVEMTNAEVTGAVCTGYRLPNPHNATSIWCPAALYDEVMLKCWKTEAENRPRFEYLAEMLDSFETGENEIRYDGDKPVSQPPRLASRKRV